MLTWFRSCLIQGNFSEDNKKKTTFLGNQRKFPRHHKSEVLGGQANLVEDDRNFEKLSQNILAVPL